METKAISLLEHTHITEMHEDLNRKLQEASRKDLGRGDELRKSVLSLVVAENYDGAKARMVDYVASKHSFPLFQDRVQRYVQHCSELIHAIQAKRNFPGLAALSLSRQQEIHEKVLGHFEELKQNLRHVERVERDHRLVDVRSTVWVLKSLSVTAGLIFAMAFYNDLQSGLLSSLVYSVNNWADKASTWFVNLIM